MTRVVSLGFALVVGSVAGLLPVRRAAATFYLAVKSRQS